MLKGMSSTARTSKPWSLLSADGALSLPVPEGGGVIGTKGSLRVEMAGLSRRHARLTPVDGGLEVADLGSKNGTWLQDRRIDSAVLRPGDTVRFGGAAFEVRQTAPAPEAMALDLASAPALRLEATMDLSRGLPLSWLAAIRQAPAGLDGLAPILSADGVWGIRWSRPVEPILTDGGGPPRALRVGALRDAVAGILRDGGHQTGAGGGLCWALRAESSEAVGVVLAGLTHPQAPELARTLLALHRPAEVAPAPAPRGIPPLPAGIIHGSSPAMTAVYSRVSALSSVDMGVLITGETGTGKEHIAGLLHAWSDRSGGPMVALNCAVLPAALLESELFGIDSGVATGVSARPGRFRQASGGVLFLDEVGELPPTVQAALLRVIQEKCVLPLGRAEPVAVDVRIVAATNRDLAAEVEAGRFRADLYYRLAPVEVALPPLRERREDIPALVRGFALQACAQLGRSIQGFSLGAMENLQGQPWPGNIRQLQSAVFRLVLECPAGGVVGRAMLPEAPAPEPASPDEDLNLPARVAALEQRLIAAALARSGGNRSQAARLLGLSRNGLLNKLKRSEADEAT